ncbi:glycosyltransferase family 2 protein [Sinomonas atrocyanea]|uniref:glycosyltransferase family 2 protein n=1 Tax=Sinomonas atrocyanea TaxID=37927 RepID=UPI003D9916D1
MQGKGAKALKRKSASVLVAILTYRREGILKNCLTSIEHQEGIARERFDILIADNDPASEIEEYARLGEARRKFGQGSIARGRQAVLDYARDVGYEMLVFIDDDEVATPKWLSSLVLLANEDNATAVAGPVIPSTAETRNQSLFGRTRRATGESLEAAGAGNLLLKIDYLGGIAFDPAWPLNGGEDTDFTYRLTKSGGKIVWCDEAVVIEPVDPRRISARWLIKRYFDNGRILARCRGADRFAVARLLVGALVTFTLPLAVFWGRSFRYVLEYGIRQLGYAAESMSLGSTR